MHVAVATGGYWGHSGVGTSVREWVAHLSQAGVLISVIAPDVDEGARNGNLRFLRIPDVRFAPQVIFYFWRLVFTHRKQRIDVVHTHDSILFLASYLFGKCAGIPNVFTFHASIFSEGREVDYSWLATRIFRFTNRFVARRADKLVCVSREMVRCARYAGAREDKLVLFHNPIDLSMFKPPTIESDKEGVCLYVGALRPSKGVEYLLRAVPAARQQVAGLKVLIVGDGPERGTLEALSQLLGVQDVVRFLGRVDREELTTYYQQATVFVMPSLNEPQGIVVLEAMACGLPVVASDVGGIPEMVRDQYNGLLISPRDGEALARALVRVLSDETLRERLSQGALKTAREFSWEANTDRLFSVYTSVSKG